jgi:glycosyltransferase involved in cell wall biosynthesis
VLGFGDGSLFEPSSGLRALRDPGVAISALKSRMKLWRLCDYDAFIVETAAMQETLSTRVKGKVIHVVPNAPSDWFDPSASPIPSRNIELPQALPDEVRLFYPARGWPHKNHALLWRASVAYRQRYGRRLSFVTTLRGSEVRALGLEDAECLINVGEVEVRDCAALMRMCDGVVFPSLNETSSATPLEAARLGKLLFASDRDFVRNTVGGFPVYFDPLAPEDLAEKVDIFLGPRGIHQNSRTSAGEHLTLTTERERATSYMASLHEVLTAR